MGLLMLSAEREGVGWNSFLNEVVAAADAADAAEEHQDGQKQQEHQAAEKENKMSFQIHVKDLHDPKEGEYPTQGHSLYDNRTTIFWTFLIGPKLFQE